MLHDICQVSKYLTSFWQERDMLLVFISFLYQIYVENNFQMTVIYWWIYSSLLQ